MSVHVDWSIWFLATPFVLLYMCIDLQRMCDKKFGRCKNTSAEASTYLIESSSSGYSFIIGRRK
jgi:hypothetical protein